jgi:hypothetical protein
MHYEKKGCFAIGPTIQFLSCNDHLQFIVCIVHFITIQLQLYGNNSFSTSMKLHNYNHDIMLTLLIFIHPLKFDMWHYEEFWIF